MVNKDILDAIDKMEVEDLEELKTVIEVTLEDRATDRDDDYEPDEDDEDDDYEEVEEEITPSAPNVEVNIDEI